MKKLPKIDFFVYFLTDCVGIGIGLTIMLFGYFHPALGALSISFIFLGIMFTCLCGVLLIRLQKPKKNNSSAEKPYHVYQKKEIKK